MRWIVLVLFTISIHSFADEEFEDFEDEKPPTRPFLFSHLRAGFLADPADKEVDGKWEHKLSKSPTVALGAYGKVTPRWNMVYIFTGADFRYLQSREEIEDIYILTEAWQFFLTGGVSLEPVRFGGRWGASLTSSVRIMEEFKSDLHARGFTREINDESYDSGSILPIDAFFFGLNLYFKIVPRWWVTLSSETGVTGTSVNLGVSYVFIK